MKARDVAIAVHEFCAHRVTPFTIEFLLETANMLVKMDQYDEAESNLRQAMSVWHMKSSAKDLLPEGEKWREETFSDVLKMLGTTCDKAGRRLEAEEYYRSALEIYRSHGREVKIVDTNRLLVINLCAQVGFSIRKYHRPSFALAQLRQLALPARWVLKHSSFIFAGKERRQL